MRHQRSALRLGGSALAAAVWTMVGGSAPAQTSYFSATGTFTSSGGSSQDFLLSFAQSAPIDTTFRTWAYKGGTNAAGDTIAPGGIDSIIEVFSSGGSSLGWNDDLGSNFQRDSLLSPSGVNLTYIPPLGPGSYRYNLTASDPVIGDGHWAADMTRAGTYRLTGLSGTSSIVSSLKIGSDLANGAVVEVRGSGLNLSGVLEVRDGGMVDVQGGTFRTTAASLSGTGQLDLHTNSMIVDYSGASPLATIGSYIQSGYANGAWNGSGIMSSSAGGAHLLGYGDNAVLGIGTFAGQEVDSTTVLVKYTYAGDTNLDGQVDVIDLGNLATGWQTSAPWTGGDSNYDGQVDVIDLGMLATNWQAGVGNPLGPGSLGEALAAYGLPNVPEPGMFAAMGFGGAIGLGRRRRVHRAVTN